MTNDLSASLFFLLTFLLLLLFLFANIPSPLALLFSSLLFLFLLYTYRSFRDFPFFQNYSRIKTAYLLEEKFTEAKGKIVPGVSLAQDYQQLIKGKENYSPSLIDAAINETYEIIKKLPVNKIVNRQLLRKGVISFLATVTILTIFAFFFPKKFLFSLYSLFSPNKIPLIISLHPKEIFTLPNQEVKIGIEIKSPYQFSSGSLYLEPLSNGKKGKVLPLKFKNNRTEYQLSPNQEVTYYVKVFNRLSEKGIIRLLIPPELLRLEVFLSPPPYTVLPSSRIDFPKEINCLKGTEIRINGKANKLTDILLLRDGKLATQYPKTDTFSFSFFATGDTTLLVKLAEKEAEKTYPIKISYLPDEQPFVRFLLPGRDLDIPESMKILLYLVGLDDFGIGEISLFYHHKEHPEEKIKFYSRFPKKRTDTVAFVWDLTKINLLPGDELIYYALISDNDPAGAKFSKSNEYKLRFPTLTEIYSQTIEKREEIKSSLSTQLQESEKISEEIEDLISSLKKERKLSWEEKRALEATLEKKEEILSALKKLREEVAEMMEELLESAVYDRETMEKLEELEKLLSEILPQELKSAIAKLRDALEKKSADLSQILKKMKMTTEELKNQLARSIEILKRLQEEAKLSELEKKLAEMGKKQKSLEEEINKIPKEKLAEREKEIADALKSWEKELNDLQLSEKELQEILEEIKKELAEKPFSKMAERIREKIGEGKLGEAKNRSENLRRQLSQMQKKLRELTQGMKKKRHQEIIDKLWHYALELCQITEYTEDLEKATKERREVDDLIGKSRGLAEGTKNVADSILALSARSLSISPRLADDLLKAISALEEGGNLLFEKNYSGGENKFSEAKVNLNNTIENILFLLTLAQKGGMGGGLDDFLSALSQGLNEMSEILSKMGGMPIPIPSPLSSEQLSALQRILGRHRSLRERLEEMMKGLSEKPGLTGAMEGIIEEMKKIEEDMEKLNITRELVEREEKVFQRLLDVERSIRKKEAEEKREREVGKEFQIEERPILPQDLGEKKRLLQEELLKALQENYPREYYRLIKEYFDALIYEE